MFCPKCGSNVDNNTKFCSECGADVTANVAQPQPVAAYAQPTYQAPAQPQYAQNNFTPPPPQPQYARPAYQPQPAAFSNDAPMTVGQYIVTFLLTAIPFAGFILLLMWAFGSNVNKNKKNLARAVLIMGIIGGVIYAIIFAIMIAAGAAMASSAGSYY